MRRPSRGSAGVSVENAQATSRIAHLQRTNAAIRFLSVEPMIGPVGKLDLAGIEARAVSDSGPRRTGQAELAAAQCRGDIVIEMDDADRRVTVSWNDAEFGETAVGFSTTAARW